MPIAANISATQRLLITITVMSAAIMQVLDTTIVNVALPHMQGALSASADQISWTLTSYLVSSAIFMPLTGYFTERFGYKKYLLLCVGGFTLASVLCGASLTLTEIILFRLLQGIFGAALVPLSQAILADVYPPEERGKAMAIWGMGVMIGPILGPTLGGYLTEVASWRWTFYVNLPIGLLSLFLAWFAVPETATHKRIIYWPGLILLSLTIGAAQYLLDRGNQQDWFNAQDIRIAALLCAIGLAGFIFYSLRYPSRTIFDLRIFQDRNFTIACLLIAIMGLGMYGSLVIQPLMLENLLNYPVLTTGLAMAPRGISGMLGMFIVGKLVNYVDLRWIISGGILLSVIGVGACTHYSQDINIWWIVWPLLLQGFGMSMVFIPLSVLAFSTLNSSSRAEATGLYSLLRTIGSSMGISITITIYTRHAQMAWNQLSGFIQPYNFALHAYLKGLQLHYYDAKAVAILGNTLAQQAEMLAFIDAYAFIGWSFVVMLPLLLLIRKSKKAQVTPIIAE